MLASIWLNNQPIQVIQYACKITYPLVPFLHINAKESNPLANDITKSRKKKVEGNKENVAKS